MGSPRLRLLLGLLLAVPACASASEDVDASGGALSGYFEDETRTASTRDPVFLFGGEDSDVPLGCVLNCRDDEDVWILSRWNKGSTYGDTIWNRFSVYGSDFSTVSPWNRFAPDPPRLLSKDRRKNYGRFTVNSGSEQTRLTEALAILAAGREAKR